ncbi:MAG TPA: adenylate/guanylate cyclase domain-containing protein, partial [Gemmatimonadota bacterium]|nr:adenylate/guanylate cyclase domain-containing protein [Gemmatimonadota bacterium]
MNVRHRLAAICFADIVDYSRLSATDQKAAMRLVAVFEEAVGESIGRYGGRVVKFLGDGVLAEFPSVQGAIAAADALQRGFGETAVAAGFAAAALRVGIHSGEIVERGDGDVYGDGVNVAQRVQQSAGPGEIVVSEDAWRQGRQHAEIEFEPLGGRELKGVGQVELYRVRLASGIEPESEEPEAHGGWETFVGELKRRHVFRVAAIYTVVAWLVVQVANATFGPLGVPAWVLTLVVVVALVGAPVMVALAWAFDWTAGGIRRTHPGALPPSRAQRLGRQLVATVAVLAAVPVGWVVFHAGTDRGMPAGGAADAAAVVLDPARLAVLYFDDLSENGELGHLAEGITEALIDELDRIDVLEIVSRHGVREFREGGVPPDSIAARLGAGMLIDGSVGRREGSLQIQVRLVDAADLTQIASFTEERPEEEVFSLVNDVAADVSAVLRQRLGREIRFRARSRSAGSVEAWEIFQRADRLREQALKASGDPRVAASLRHQADTLLARAQWLDPEWAEPPLGRVELA